MYDDIPIEFYAFETQSDSYGAGVVEYYGFTLAGEPMPCEAVIYRNETIGTLFYLDKSCYFVKYQGQSFASIHNKGSSHVVEVISCIVGSVGLILCAFYRYSKAKQAKGYRTLRLSKADLATDPARVALQSGENVGNPDDTDKRYNSLVA